MPPRGEADQPGPISTQARFVAESEGIWDK